MKLSLSGKVKVSMIVSTQWDFYGCVLMCRLVASMCELKWSSSTSTDEKHNGNKNHDNGVAEVKRHAIAANLLS